MRRLFASRLHEGIRAQPAQRKASNLRPIGRQVMLFASARDVDVPGATLEQRLERAKGYPYSRPASSFIFAGGTSHSLSNDLWKGPQKLNDMLSTISPASSWNFKDDESVEWHPVLAIGSNASPEQLARKYTNSDIIVPVQPVLHGAVGSCGAEQVVQCVLQDFDVVYAPLVSSYGSCTATLAYAPGTMVEVFVTYLTSALLDRMIETEGAYDLVKLRNIDLKMGLSLAQYQEGRQPVDHLDAILQFNHQKGTLNLPLEPSQNGRPPECAARAKRVMFAGDASPVCLKAIPAQNRQFPELEQVEMLTRIMQHTMPSNGIDVDSWIQQNLEDEDTRQSLVEQLVSLSHPFTYPNTEVLMRIGHIHSKNVK